CGGSSGGSGAAAAADLAAGTLGTDTGGSIRIPAAFCGVTGVRPTQGVVPDGGLFPVAPTFDTIGPIARSAEDCALLFDAIAGTSTDVSGGVQGLRVGVVTPLFELASPEGAAVAEWAVAGLARLGASVARAESPLLARA